MTSYLLPKVTWQTPNPFCQFTFWTFWPFANLPQWPFTIECCGILTSTGSCQLHAYFRGHSRPRPQFDAIRDHSRPFETATSIWCHSRPFEAANSIRSHLRPWPCFEAIKVAISIWCHTRSFEALISIWGHSRPRPQLIWCLLRPLRQRSQSEVIRGRDLKLIPFEARNWKLRFC